MEVEVLEDDVFFAELSKQISLLITDDDEEFGPEQYTTSTSPVPGFSFAHVPQAVSMPPNYTLYHQVASYNSNNIRSWECSSKGTGVFIPRSSPNPTHTRKKSKSKTSSSNTIASTTTNSLQKPRQAAGKSAVAVISAGAQRRRV